MPKSQRFKKCFRRNEYAASDAGVKHVKIQDIHSSELTKRDRFEKGLIKNKKQLIFADRIAKRKKDYQN